MLITVLSAVGCGSPSRRGSVAPTSAAAPEPTTTAAASFYSRPYAPTSPWNTPVGSIHSDNEALMSRLITRAPLTSDPTQYAFPLYQITPSTPRRSVRLSGHFST